LFLTGAVRVDNNSAFGKDFSFATYPKVAGTWVISEEPFWGLDFINTLKLRSAFGVSGLQPDVFTALRTFQPTTGTGDQAVVTRSSSATRTSSPNAAPKSSSASTP
jgi:hypothetical protein